MGGLEYLKRTKYGKCQTGKAETHLTAQLQAVKWGEFKIGDLFEIETSAKRFDANKITLSETGYPYVVRTSQNNGIKGYLKENECYLNDGNTISLGQDTATVFYQKTPYFTGDKIKIVKAKTGFLSAKNAQFILTLMEKTFSTFSWGSSSFNVEILSKQKIQLPLKHGIEYQPLRPSEKTDFSGENADTDHQSAVDKAYQDYINQIDFEFIERFVAELEALRVAELEAYLLATGLTNTQLSASEQKVIDEFASDMVGGVEHGKNSVSTKYSTKSNKAED
ncbi:restriction endonuclease subunit S [Spirabiliibacterium falconis]|uniref:restriction endonuclease subunit S n=1 Tax=Spirabiliibacterium falconis TaxID=572023 RepID=UPI001AADADC3|nr:restriction endonuclease subunit S [Spirabiliibacterium falconis]MBE2893768.1 restriction endonuclease [Spirabiliibacterium falconis]